MDSIKVDEEALERLKNALQTAGESYKSNFARLGNLIEQITKGDIQGNPATELLTKFKNKEQTFRNVEKAINDAEEYTGVKKSDFVQRIEDISSGMR